MTIPVAAVLAALVVSVIVATTADWAVRVMRPRQSVPLLAGAALTVAVAGGLALGAVGLAMLAGMRTLAGGTDERWSAATVHTELPVPRWAGALAALAFGVLLACAVVRTIRIAVSLGRADRLARRLRGRCGPIVMVNDAAGDAFTISGTRGCVVISRELFAGLEPAERAVLAAHELSHLNRRHHLYVHAAELAAAANPLLRNVGDAVRLGVERWADEDAARALGDRPATGRALAGVALRRHRLAQAHPIGPGPRRGSRWALRVSASHVTVRVQALLESPVRSRAPQLVLTAVAAGLALVIGLTSLHHVHEAIEMARPSFAGF